MRMPILLLFLFLLLPALVPAQQIPTENALLWEIRHPRVPASSWLFGTIHMIPEKDFHLPASLLQRLSDCEVLVLELDMDEAMNPMTQMALLPKMMMPDGLRLRDLLEEADYTLVMQNLDASGLPGFLMENLKPLFLSALIDPGMGMGDADGLESYDMRLYEKAKSLGLEHSGLETIDQQLTAFDAIPLADQARMLVAQLKGEGEGQDELGALIDAYKTEDLARLQQLMLAQQLAAKGDAMESLLYTRNRNWIPIMGEKMKEKKVFFAVGAGHLPGEQGVVHLLRQAGWEVIPRPVFRP